MKELFWDGLCVARALYESQMDAVSRAQDLARVELDILLFLANNPQFDTATDIVERRCISKAHVSQSVKSLEQRGYLERRYAGDNRRTIHLHLLEGAQSAVDAGRKAQARSFAAMLDGFSEAEREQLRSYLSRISDNAWAQMKKGDD